MRRHCKTREERLNAKRDACADDDARTTCGQYWHTDSGFWAWQSKSGKLGLAHTAKQAIEKCVQQAA